MARLDPEILTQPVLPFSQHGVSPRRIMGADAWADIKHDAQRRANNQCEICGTYIAHAPGDWMELHEQYEYNYCDRTITLKGMAIACHTCHMYIHIGLTRTQLKTGVITQAQYEDIVSHGDAIIKANGLTHEKILNQRRMRQAMFDPWLLIYKGHAYCNTYGVKQNKRLLHNVDRYASNIYEIDMNTHKVIKQIL